MKLYDSVGPNPRIVRMFMAEKDISMPKQTVDLRGGENRQADWKDQIERDRRRQIDASRQNVAERRSIEAIDHHAEPDHVRDHHRGKGGDVPDQCRHGVLSSWSAGGTSAQ